MILVIDNYDSFTYNIVQYLGELNADILVRRNDEITVEQIRNELKPERILISPGPGTPDDAGISLEVLKISPINCRFLGFVSDIKPSVKFLVAKWFVRRFLSTANTPKFVTTEKVFLRA